MPVLKPPASGIQRGLKIRSGGLLGFRVSGLLSEDLPYVAFPTALREQMVAVKP